MTTLTPAIGMEYFNNYIQLVNNDDIIAALTAQGTQTKALLSTIDEAKGNFRYASGKWTIKELIGHLCDTERIFAYRALRFSRMDKTTLSPFEQDDYVAAADFKSRLLNDLTLEFFLLRQSNLVLFKSFAAGVLERTGVSGTTTFSVKNILYIIAGHEIHHLKILNERYL